MLQRLAALFLPTVIVSSQRLVQKCTDDSSLFQQSVEKVRLIGLYGNSRLIALYGADYLTEGSVNTVHHMLAAIIKRKNIKSLATTYKVSINEWLQQPGTPSTKLLLR